MPDFIIDVQGLQTTLETPNGAIDVGNGRSFRFAEGKSKQQVSITGVFRFQETRLTFPVIHKRSTVRVGKA